MVNGVEWMNYREWSGEEGWRGRGSGIWIREGGIGSGGGDLGVKEGGGWVGEGVIWFGEWVEGGGVRGEDLGKRRWCRG